MTILARQKDVRKAGVLLHPTSIPGATLGKEAHKFVDLLADMGCSLWQMLPIGPVDPTGSPYSSPSSAAGNAKLIDLPSLVDWGWLRSPEQTKPNNCLTVARRHFTQRANKQAQQSWEMFGNPGLEDYALYRALKRENNNRAWMDWPTPLRDRWTGPLAEARIRLEDDINDCRFEQFVFDQQWQALFDHAHARGISLIGDLPLYVAHDSADVWCHRDLFKLSDDGQATWVAGVPPDYFSEHGQLWGNPVYRWERHESRNFGWWLNRIETLLKRFDLLRIDHFRALDSCWEIPADAETAVKGHWTNVPGNELLLFLAQHLGSLPFIAEDLGIITPSVTRLRKMHNLPGMAVLQFAFDGHNDNTYLPHNHSPATVVYTGTHDNDTTLGWWDTCENRDYVMAYMGEGISAMPWAMIRLALACVCQTAIIPFQDVLSLPTNARMNTPGTTSGNWAWQFSWSEIDTAVIDRFRNLAQLYGRLKPPH